jgi:hypothetical protein
MAQLCLDNHLIDLALEVLEKVSERSRIARIISQVPNDKKEKIYVKVGFQSAGFYSNEAKRVEGSNRADAIRYDIFLVSKVSRYYALSGDNAKAAEIYCSYMKQLFSQEPWEWKLIEEATNAVYICDAENLPFK